MPGRSATRITTHVRTVTIAAVCAAVALATGCGGSGSSDTAAIRAALAASPRTLLHYGPSTWGRNPHLHVRLVVHGDQATAFISGQQAMQKVKLTRSGGTWSVASAEASGVNGPHASRPATKAELAAISAVAGRGLPRAAVGCFTYGATISTVDPRYARVDRIYPPSQLRHPHGRCGLFVGNGVDIYLHTSAGWRHVISGSMFYCNNAPPAVLRSLVGGCVLG